MRKTFALVMVALLSLTIALAAVSCGKKAEETTPTTTPMTTPTMSDTSAMTDTTMGGMAQDTTKHE